MAEGIPCPKLAKIAKNLLNYTLSKQVKCVKSCTRTCKA